MCSWIDLHFGPLADVALLVAIAEGHLDTASLLLDHGADFRSSGDGHEVGLAADKGHAEIAKLLLSRYEAKELKALLRDFESGRDDDLLTTLLKDEIKMRGCKVVKKTDKKKVRK